MTLMTAVVSVIRTSCDLDAVTNQNVSCDKRSTGAQVQSENYRQAQRTEASLTENMNSTETLLTSVPTLK